MINNNMEKFKKNLEGQGFSFEFIQKSVEYLTELEEERELQEMNTIEEVIQYYDTCGSFTCNTLESECNLQNLRSDIAKLFECDTNNIIDYSKYFENIEEFELQLLYTLYYEFYLQENL